MRSGRLRGRQRSGAAAVAGTDGQVPGLPLACAIPAADPARARSYARNVHTRPAGAESPAQRPASSGKADRQTATEIHTRASGHAHKGVQAAQQHSKRD